MKKIEIKVPALGESITEATIAKWHKSVGEKVEIDDLLVELETEKVMLEVNATASGFIDSIHKNENDNVCVGETICHICETKVNVDANTDDKVANFSDQPAKISSTTQNVDETYISEDQRSNRTKNINTQQNLDDTPPPLFPSIKKMIHESPINLQSITGTGKGGRITKEDILKYNNQVYRTENLQTDNVKSQSQNQAIQMDTSRVNKVKMTRLRKTIAQRLKDSQNTAAILSTFNEVDMHNIMALRSKYKDIFEKKHGVKLGFMSFFVKAVLYALKAIPSVNSEIDNDHILYKNYYDIGVAVGTNQGLVVPVVRNVDNLSFAEIEKEITNLATKAREGKLGISDLTGGTFSITNGGVYGSLLSTPIINPPQSGILGMHSIQKKPVVVDDQIVIRPMMYLALSYDHRIIDGKEAVTFLVKVKNILENPERLIFDV